MKEEISLTKALEIIKAVDATGRNIPFDISFRTLQRNSKTGGVLYEYKQVVRFQKKYTKNPNFLKIVQSTEKRKRNPHHFANRTINVELQNGDIRTIHIRLIIMVNGKKVIY